MEYMKLIMRKIWRRIRERYYEGKLNRVRKKAMNDLRYWRATAQTGTIDLGHLNEADAVAATAKMGPIINVDWVNAIILYGSVIPENKPTEGL